MTAWELYLLVVYVYFNFSFGEVNESSCYVLYSGKNKSFNYYPAPMPYLKALHVCREPQNGNLAVLAQNVQLQHLRKFPAESLWVGARKVEDEWKWVGEIPIQPSALGLMKGDPGECLLLNSEKNNAMWKSANCGENHPILCELENVPYAPKPFCFNNSVLMDIMNNENQVVAEKLRQKGAATIIGVACALYGVLVVTVIVSSVICLKRRRNKGPQEIREATNDPSSAVGDIHDSVTHSDADITSGDTGFDDVINSGAPSWNEDDWNMNVANSDKKINVTQDNVNHFISSEENLEEMVENKEINDNNSWSNENDNVNDMAIEEESAYSDTGADEQKRSDVREGLIGSGLI